MRTRVIKGYKPVLDASKLGKPTTAARAKMTAFFRPTISSSKERERPTQWSSS